MAVADNSGQAPIGWSLDPTSNRDAEMPLEPLAQQVEQLLLEPLMPALPLPMRMDPLLQRSHRLSNHPHPEVLRIR